MIKINKLPKPKILQENDKVWTAEYLNALQNKTLLTDKIKNRYNNDEIKQTLIEETHGKCAYCESKLKHISFSDIEHILPKSQRPDLYVEWSNLTISCEICNRINKKDYYNPNDPLLNPILDIPSEHLMSLGAILYKIPGSRKGEISISILDLNRTELIERRTEKLNSFAMLVDKYSTETNEKIKALLKEEIIRESSENSEYSFMLSSYLKYTNIT